MTKFGLRASFVIRHSDFAINVTSFSIDFVALDAPMPQATRPPLQCPSEQLDDSALALKLLALAPIHETLSAFYYCWWDRIGHAGQRSDALSGKAAAASHYSRG